MDLPPGCSQDPRGQTLTYQLRRVAANLESLILEDRTPTPPEELDISSLSLTGVSPVELDSVGLQLLDAYQEDDSMVSANQASGQLPTLQPSTLLELAQLGTNLPNQPFAHETFAFTPNPICARPKSDVMSFSGEENPFTFDWQPPSHWLDTNEVSRQFQQQLAQHNQAVAQNVLGPIAPPSGPPPSVNQVGQMLPPPPPPARAKRPGTPYPRDHRG